MCGSLRTTDVGSAVRLGGWVQRTRDLGGIVFLDLRDRAGVVQVSFDPRWTPADVIARAGRLGFRPADAQNPELETGGVEVRATALREVGPAETPAIPVVRGRGEQLAAEELRLRHRYLDLRRADLQKNLILRHRLLQSTRRYLSDRGFLEIETPILTKPTPEGARDYLVPSRVHPGEFYALPQSPQLYKQLLMVSGFDRYFQLARCFRDEDLRADRQPEFTQIDIEASFVRQEDVLAVAEGLVGVLFAEIGVTPPAHFRRLTYVEAMERYGIDRPDLRYGLELFDATAVFRATEFGIARSAIEAGGRVRGIRLPQAAAWSRKQVDELEALAKSAGAAGLIRLRRAGGVLEGPAAKYLPSGAADHLQLAEGDLALLVAGPDRVSSPALARVRQESARRIGLVPSNAYEFLWVLDFPLFEQDAVTGGWGAVHHPFTAPHPDDLSLLTSDPGRVRAVAYDVVLNGTELGGGSIRISDPSVQEAVFRVLGIAEEEARARFGFLLEGLRGGAPPHGGIAFGFDRIAMVLSGATSLRDVIAYPKTTAARALFEGAPARVPDDQLSELHIRPVLEPVHAEATTRD
jgi:aspartyl-tRNA synthetase